MIKNTSYKVQADVDADFIANGSQWKIAATNRDVQVWDIIFFFSKLQSYA
jgi:hypothetical protein